MDDAFPDPPATGTPMAPTLPSSQARALLALRRSAGKQAMAAPGPDPETLDAILRVAMRVPDHRRVEPWRFIVFEGDARAVFGDTLASIHRAQDGEATAKALEETRTLLLRAPVVVGVVSSPDAGHKTPVWEQELSAGAVCQSLLLAANSAGWAGCWLTEWIAYDAEVGAHLGLDSHERIAGFVYLGTATADPPERPRPDMAARITRWTGSQGLAAK